MGEVTAQAELQAAEAETGKGPPRAFGSPD